MEIEGNKKIDDKISDNNTTTSIDFELDAMDYALKNLPPQNKKIFLKNKNLTSQESKKDFQEKKPEIFIKKEEPQKTPPSTLSSNIINSLNKFPAPNPNIKIVSKKNSSALIIVLTTILILCLLGGGFYYFQYFFKNKNTTIEGNSNPTIQPSIIPTQTPEKPKTIHPFLDQTEELILTNETPTEKITFLKQALIGNPALKESLSNGFFYQIKKNDQYLSAEEILQAFDISFPIETTSSFKEGWVFVYLDENSILKMGLIFETLPEKYNNSLILNMENDLPLSLKNIFIEEDTTIQVNPIIFQTNPKENRLRYFNFVENNDTKTIDWAKINNYLFFTTSKDSAFKIISILEKNN